MMTDLSPLKTDVLISSQHDDFSRYRPNVGIILMNAEGRIFTAQRNDCFESAWQMPQGGIDEGESIFQASLRELREETNVTSVSYVKTIPDADDLWLYYNLPQEFQHTFWDGSFWGQRQKWIVYKFTGRDDEILLDTHQREFSQWQWSEKKDIVDRIVAFKKGVYCQVVEDL